MKVLTIPGKRRLTMDRVVPAEKSAMPVTIHTVEQLGPNMSKLPNGNLLCANVPIARTGIMMYGPGETPIEPGSNGIAYVERTAEDLFDAVCIGSFMGVAVVDEHPDEDVTPKNWKTLSRGFATTNVRRGTDHDADVLLADLIITEKALIESVLSGKREVSCGYDADYLPTGDGMGKQTHIVGNHIALVEKGRCGPRCAIGDREFQHQPQAKKEQPMATKRVSIKSGATTRRAVLDGLRQKALDAFEELDQAQLDGDEEETGGDTHIHIHSDGSPAKETTLDQPGDLPAGDPKPDGSDNPMESRMVALETAVKTLGEGMAKLLAGGNTTPADPAKPAMDAEMDEEETNDGELPPELKEKMEEKKAGTQDSAALQTSYTATLAQAEVLVPGFRMPTFDAKATRKATVDAMCQSRRKVLDVVYATADGQALVNGVSGAGNLDLASMTCVDVANLFRSAAGAKAMLNNSTATRDSSKLPEAPKPAVGSIVAMNEANRKYWEGKKAK
jgi:uncharacterized protein